MPGAVIVANQNTGAGAGSPGVARNDLWQAQAVDLLDGAGGNASWEWTLLDKPPGSAAALTGASTAAAAFTPDLLGTYRVQLITNGGGPGNISIKVFRVRRDLTGVLSGRGWAMPGLGEIDGESNYPGNSRAWAEVFEFITADILNEYRFIPRLPARSIIPGALDKSTVQASFVAVGTLSFDPTAFFAGSSQILRAIVFDTLVAVDPVGGLGLEIRLFNVTDGEVVTSTLLTSTSSVVERKVSVALTVGGAAGNIKNGLRIYEVQLRRTGGGGADNVYCKAAQVNVSHTTI